MGMDPPTMLGKAVNPALTSASPWGEEYVERRAAAPGCMQGGHPRQANVPLRLFGTRQLRRSRPAPGKACSPSHTARGSAAW